VAREIQQDKNRDFHIVGYHDFQGVVADTAFATTYKQIKPSLSFQAESGAKIEQNPGRDFNFSIVGRQGFQGAVADAAFEGLCHVLVVPWFASDG